MNPYRRHLLHARAALAAAAGLLLATAAAGQPFGPVEGGRVVTFGAGFARYPRFYDGDVREARYVSRLNVTTGTLGAQV